MEPCLNALGLVIEHAERQNHEQCVAACKHQSVGLFAGPFAAVFLVTRACAGCQRVRRLRLSMMKWCARPSCISSPYSSFRSQLLLAISSFPEPPSPRRGDDRSAGVALDQLRDSPTWGPCRKKKRGEQTTGRLEADSEEVVEKLSGAAEVTRLRNVVEFRFNV